MTTATENDTEAQKNTDSKAEGEDVRYSLGKYDEHTKENWRNSKKIVVYEDEGQLKQFISDSLEGKYNQEPKKMYFGSIGGDLAKRIFNETGIQVSGFNLSISSNEIRKIIMYSHNELTEQPRGQRKITVNDIVSIPNIIETADKILLDEKLYENKPVLHFVKTKNGKTTIVSYVSRKHKDLGVQTMYASKKNSSLATATDVQASVITSETTSSTATTNSIPDNFGNVNTQNTSHSLPQSDSMGNTLSEQQKEYFKDSKVVDENGNLMVMYHQTEGDFTKFNTHHKGAGSYDYETPYGIFLKPSSADIGLKGSKQMKLYANITNPLRVSDRSELNSYLKTNHQYVDAVAEVDKANAYYKSKFDEAKENFKNYLIEWRNNNPEAKRSDIYKDNKFNEIYDAEEKIIDEWTEKINVLSEKAKKLVNDILVNDGYDGVIISTDKGSFGRSTKTVIALNSNQVKKLDNKNPTADKDIRYSLSESKSVQQSLDKTDGVVYDENGLRLNKKQYAMLQSNLMRKMASYIANNTNLPKYDAVYSDNSAYYLRIYDVTDFDVMCQIDTEKCNSTRDILKLLRSVYENDENAGEFRESVSVFEEGTELSGRRHSSNSDDMLYGRSNDSYGRIFERGVRKGDSDQGQTGGESTRHSTDLLKTRFSLSPDQIAEVGDLNEFPFFTIPDGKILCPRQVDLRKMQ